MDWSTWLQGLGSTAVGVYADKQRAEHESNLRRLEMQTTAAMQPAPVIQGSVSPTVLLIGGAVLVAVLVMSNKD